MSAADTPHPTAPRVAPRFDWAFTLTIVGLGAAFVAAKVFQHAGAFTADLDTGKYSNLAWALLHGEGFTGSVLGRHHLGEHFSPVMLLIAPIYLVAPTAHVLMVLHATSLVLAIAFALKLGERLMLDAGVESRAARIVAGAGFVALLFFYAPFNGAFASQFQPVVLGMPLVIAAAWAMHARRSAWLIASVLLLLMTRESAPLSVIGLAIYAGLVLRRTRLAIVLIVVALAWGGVTMGVVMPAFRDGTRWMHQKHVDPWALWWPAKAQYLAAIALALGLLPWWGRRAMACVLASVPGLLLNLAAGREAQVNFAGHYDGQIVAFWMLAALHGSAGLTRWCADEPIGRSTLAIALCAALAGAGYAGPSIPTAAHRLVEWWPDRDRLALVAEARALAAKHADAPALAANNSIGPQVCHRPRYRAMRFDSPAGWRAWASDRIEPGTVLLVTNASVDQSNRQRDAIRSDPNVKLIERGSFVDVYVYRP